jgi:hypothetical protein
MADGDHTIVRVQVDSTKLVHAGLVCFMSLSATRLYTGGSTRTEAGLLRIIRALKRDCANPVGACLFAFFNAMHSNGLRIAKGVESPGTPQTMQDHGQRRHEICLTSVLIGYNVS